MTSHDDLVAVHEVPLREQVLHAFARFGPAWVRFLQTTISSRDISPSGMRLLSLLRRGASHPIMRNLVNDLGTTARAVTGLVDTLEREGLVRREAHPSDRRATCIVLTERGQNIADRLWEGHLEAASTFFDVLSPEDQATLVRILGVLADELAARGHRVAPDCVPPGPAGGPDERGGGPPWPTS